MKKLNLTLFTLSIILSMGTTCFGQTDSAKTLVEQGIKLNDAGNYTGAIEKYNAALKADPAYVRADYEKGFTLYVSGKAKEAIPYLEIVLKSNEYADDADDLIGSIYDDSNEPDKAIEYYQIGIKANPKAERLHFNLGITYARQKKYAEAAMCEMEAIKLNPKHASAQREYGLDMYYLGNKACAVMAFCDFLLLEPKTARSKVVYGYMEKIFSNEAAQKTILISMDKDSTNISAASMINMSVSLSAQANVELNKKNPDTVANLQFALKLIFESLGKTAAKPTTPKDFFWTYYVDFYYKLAESGNMDAFTRLITLNAYPDANLAWFKENKKKLDDLQAWMQSTPRNLDGN